MNLIISNNSACENQILLPNCKAHTAIPFQYQHWNNANWVHPHLLRVSWQSGSISFRINGCLPNRQHTFTCTNVDQDVRRHAASLGHDDFSATVKPYHSSIYKVCIFCSFAADRYFAGPLDNWSTLRRQITNHLTANDCVQSPGMESNHDTNYQSVANKTEYIWTEVDLVKPKPNRLGEIKMSFELESLLLT